MERRNEPRWSADAPAACKVPATPIIATVIDISKTGCRVQGNSADIASRGATILLQLSPSLSAAGQIVWLRGKDFGVKFYRALKEDDVAQVALEDIVVTAEAGR